MSVNYWPLLAVLVVVGLGAYVGQRALAAKASLERAQGQLQTFREAVGEPDQDLPALYAPVRASTEDAVGQTRTPAWSLLEHVVTPVLVVLDYVLLGRRRTDARWWHPLTWTLAPLAYLAWYVSADLAVYDALDPARPLLMSAQVVVREWVRVM